MTVGYFLLLIPMFLGFFLPVKDRHVKFVLATGKPMVYRETERNQITILCISDRIMCTGGFRRPGED